MPNIQATKHSFSMWFEYAGVSVQWASGNYGSNYGVPNEHASPFVYTAEVAIRTSDEKGTFLTELWSKDARAGVLGYATPEQVLDALNWAAAYKPASDTGLAPVLGASLKGNPTDGL